MKRCFGFTRFWFLWLLFSWETFNTFAQAQDAPFHGFLQANYSVRMAATNQAPTGIPAKEKDLILGDERTQLELARASASGKASFSGKLDLYRDAIDEQVQLDVREAYLDLSLQKFDLRLGRQIITWGLGDLVFINDLFPKDWVAFLSGTPLEYLKLGSDALNVSFHPGFLNAQAVLIPFFEADNLPTGERLFYFNPFLSFIKGIEDSKPQQKFENFEVAGRLYRTLWKLDASLYGYKGFYRTPGMQFEPTIGRLTLFYPELGVYGASLQGALPLPFMGGVFSLEGGYYDSVEDRDGTNPQIENPAIKFLAGLSRAFGADLTVGAQYFGEAILKYDEYKQSIQPLKTMFPDFPIREKIRHTFSIRIMQFLKYQTLRLSLFAMVSPNDEDYYINPEVRYSFTDELWMALGGNIFGGAEDSTFLGQFELNDNLYMQVRYGF
jgi:hypothetical protein